ncbi:hypothetical protein TSOC_000014 [Tetrabaena socialis]|uniref:Uncharacterized protein n=1 Tax=Tetrabaena socialis TaxID=47790 RepID=A0A2J8AKD1_9CHLO|nr:hypothetical protein TSOC_000014 [Tetrabaena socialis]|eukprot:PNH12968.1 hypothetical protein TSOC_000014 [Tetrabaena socialis]
MASSSSSGGALLVPGNGSTAGRVGRSTERKGLSVKTSRVAISRLVRGRMMLRKSASPQSPPSPNQECAVNPRTGKVALGPWLGPYGPGADSPPSSPPPLFLDTNGNTFASLTAAGLLPRSSSVPLPLATEKQAAAAATAATRQLHALVGKVAQRQAAEAAAGLARQLGKRSGRGVPSGGRCGATMSRHINQPR